MGLHLIHAKETAGRELMALRTQAISSRLSNMVTEKRKTSRRNQATCQDWPQTWNTSNNSWLISRARYPNSTCSGNGSERSWKRKKKKSTALEEDRHRLTMETKRKNSEYLQLEREKKPVEIQHNLVTLGVQTRDHEIQHIRDEMAERDREVRSIKAAHDA